MWVEHWLNRISVFTRDTREQVSISQCEYTEERPYEAKATIYKTGRKFLPKPNPNRTLAWDFPASRTVRKQICLSHAVCSILLWQSKPTNPSQRKQRACRTHQKMENQPRNWQDLSQLQRMKNQELSTGQEAAVGRRKFQLFLTPRRMCPITKAWPMCVPPSHTRKDRNCLVLSISVMACWHVYYPKASHGARSGLQRKSGGFYEWRMDAG